MPTSRYTIFPIFPIFLPLASPPDLPSFSEGPHDSGGSGRPWLLSSFLALDDRNLQTG